MIGLCYSILKPADKFTSRGSPLIMRQFKLNRTFAESVYKTHRGAFETDGLPNSQQLDFLINQGKAQAKLTREIKPEDFADYRLLQEVQRESR